MKVLRYVWLAMIGAAIGLPAFGQQLPPPDEARSWIPERRKEAGGRTALVDPPLSNEERRALGLPEPEADEPNDQWSGSSTNPDLRRTDYADIEECVADAALATVLRANEAANRAPGGPVSGDFAIPFNHARELITAGEFAAALPAIDQASRHSGGLADLEMALEQLRAAAFGGLNDSAALLLSLERQLAIGGLSLETVENHCATILRLRTEIDAGNALPRGR